MKRRINRFIKLWKHKRKLERWAKICGVELTEPKLEDIRFGHAVRQDNNSTKVTMPPGEIRWIGWDIGSNNPATQHIEISIFVGGKEYQWCGNTMSFESPDRQATLEKFIQDFNTQLPTMFVSGKEASAHGN